jgi:hypothetical protein
MQNRRIIKAVAGMGAVALTVWGCETPGTMPESNAPLAPPLAGVGAPVVASAAGTVGSAGAAGVVSAPAAGTGGTGLDAAAGTGSPAPLIPDAGMAANAGSGAMATPASDWRTLLEGAWELPAGQEGYRCVRLTMTEDTYIKEFQPIAPLGTHHTLLSVNDTPRGPDGISTCSGGDNGLVTLLGSGAGENYSAGVLPEGVAYKVPKGSQLNLNLHLFNAGASTLTGTSGTSVRTTTVDQVTQFAETILAGPIMLSIPPGQSTTTGQCTIMSDTTVFAIAPHMHQLGVHLKAVLERATGGTETLFDGPYDFEDQRQTATDHLALQAGDVVQVDCTFDNDTNRDVRFGESSLDEMCFLGLYRYPVAGEGLICLH